MEDLETRERILQQAESLFMKFGVRSVSMDDIARHLGISKKTLYHHFTDKDDMVLQVLMDHLRRNEQEFEAMREGAANAIDELARISVSMRKSMEELNPSLMFDLQKYHPKAWNCWIDYKNRYVRDSVTRNLRQGIAEGYYRTTLDPEIMSIMRMEMVQLGFDENLFPRNRFSIADVQIKVFEHFIYGLLTEKGRVLYEEYKSKVNNPETINTL